MPHVTTATIRPYADSLVSILKAAVARTATTLDDAALGFLTLPPIYEWALAALAMGIDEVCHQLGLHPANEAEVREVVTNNAPRIVGAYCRGMASGLTKLADAA